MTEQEMERRFAEIDALPAEALDEIDCTMLSEAEAINDGTTVTLDAFKQDMRECSGKLNIRIPRSLHLRLREEAKEDGVSLNQYILYKLAQ